MKIKTLTPWCSLYYSELKYNISLSPSQHRAIFNLLFYFGFTYLCLSIFIGFKLWLGLAIVFLLCGGIFLYRKAGVTLSRQYLRLVTSHKHTSVKSFVLSQTGECQFIAQQRLQLSAKSHLNLWGYWLIFKPNDTKSSKFFIFKDSLSSQDQARLARTIMRVKNLKG